MEDTPRLNICEVDWESWVKLKSQPTQKKGGASFSIVDLYSGCGGMTLGAITAANLLHLQPRIVLAADHSAAAAKVYRENFNELIDTFHDGDINDLFGETSTDSPFRNTARSSPVDIFLAGPPCQGHSNLNNSTRRNDPRNRLYLNAISAIECLQPKYIIIENVPAVVHDHSDVTMNAKIRLSRAGYCVEELVVDVSRIGLPQSRRRHVIVGSRKSSFVMTSPPPRPSGILRDFISDIEEEWFSSSTLFSTPSSASAENRARVNYLFENNLFDLPDAFRPDCHRNKKHSYVSAYGRLNWNRPAQTITSGFGSMGQGRYVHPSQRRTLTPHEAARIQGFPDFFNFTSVEYRTELQQMIANAVPPPVIAELILCLLTNNH